MDEDNEQKYNESSNDDKYFNHLPNNDSMLSSLLASKGERTDKIMLYSPINTNEEMLEAAVNESNTLNNEESIFINESNI